MSGGMWVAAALSLALGIKMEDLFVNDWLYADAVICVAFFALLHKLFSDKKITPLMAIHLAMVVILVLAQNYISIAFSFADDPVKYLLKSKTLLSLFWLVFLVILMLVILHLPSRQSYDVILKQKIWGAFYSDIGVSEQIKKQKDS